MPLTYGNLIAKLRPLIWPTGEAPNLVPSHDQSFIDCLDDLQTWVPCLLIDHYDLFPQCSTLYNCGLTMLEQPPHSMVNKLSVMDKQSTLESGAVTASKVGFLVTASAAFFDAGMVGSIIKFVDGQGFVIMSFIDATRVWVADPEITGTLLPPSISSPYLYLSSHFRINQSTGLPEWLDDEDGLWHSVEILGTPGDIQLGPNQSGSA